MFLSNSKTKFCSTLNLIGAVGGNILKSKLYFNNVFNMYSNVKISLCPYIFVPVYRLYI